MLVTLVTKRIKIPEMFVFYVLRDGGRRNFFLSCVAVNFYI